MVYLANLVNSQALHRIRGYRYWLAPAGFLEGGTLATLLHQGVERATTFQLSLDTTIGTPFLVARTNIAFNLGQ